MGQKEKRAYRDAIRDRYRKASRQDKRIILDEFCAVCGYNRKYAIRLLNAPKYRKKKKRGRKSRYTDPALLKALLYIWKATDFICSIRLRAAIPLWLPFYERDNGPLPVESKEMLQSISRATLDRILKPHRVRYGRGQSGTKPGTLLRNQIPIRTSNWDITRPGFIEADTVAHCGNSLAGDFVWSLTMTDIKTCWTECRAVWNKGSGDVIEQVSHIEQSLPFELLGFDCDNGSEFLNHHLVRYFVEREQPVTFTRSRPYKKNDNAHVEQKNWTHPRHLLGYDRLADPALVPLINNLYANQWSLYQNHFCPSMKLLSKTRVGSRYRKTYDDPRTPYQRVMESPEVSEEQKMRLMTIHSALNPFALKNAVERKLKAIFRRVSVTSFVRQRI